MRFLLLVSATILLSSCQNSSYVYSLKIDIQASFEQDSVQVFIDQQEIINEQLQTDHRLGVCYIDGQTGIDLNKGRHFIKAIVNNSSTQSETFSLKSNLYIGVNFNQQTKEISFVYSKNSFLYD